LIKHLLSVDGFYFAENVGILAIIAVEQNGFYHLSHNRNHGFSRRGEMNPGIFSVW
jgi:hypothetical protein